jgi:hypothetical protein
MPTSQPRVLPLGGDYITMTMRTRKNGDACDDAEGLFKFGFMTRREVICKTN